ncbi:hypothetical protein [Armatimonas sp.]|uniref:hypothetical protein n=1 Tax=Armatimonas sp. TaxID=1872638 RepID=UPI00374DCCBC
MKKAHRIRNSRIATKLTVILLVFSLLAGGGWILWLLSERDSRLPKLALTLVQERQRARAAGLPRSFAELPKRRLLAEKDNAASLYREAVNLLPDWTPEDRRTLQRLHAPTDEISDDDAKRIVVLLKAATPALQRLKAGAQRAHCDFGWHGKLTEEEWKRRREILLACDRLAQLLQVYARDDSAAIRLVQQFTRHLTEESGLLVWYSRAYHTDLAARALFRIVHSQPERRDEAEQLWKEWSIPSGILKQMWQLQCVKEQSDSERSRRKVYKPEDEPFLDYNPLWRELDRLDHRLGWKLYADASEVINLRYWRQVKRVLESLPDDDLRAQYRALKQLDADEDGRGKAYAGYWFPQRYSGIAAQFVMAQLSYQMRWVALAVELYELTHGKRPAQLEDLPKDTPLTDPFSGKPLRFKSALLYSVGVDGKDNGGDPRQDIVISLEKEIAQPSLRSRRNTLRRPGRTSSSLE